MKRAFRYKKELTQRIHDCVDKQFAPYHFFNVFLLCNLDAKLRLSQQRSHFIDSTLIIVIGEQRRSA
jgi:hypothetical protein